VLVSGCGSSAGSEDDPKTLVVVTHDSWAMPKEVLAAFERKTSITVKVQPQGDAGQLTNKLVLTKDSPLADGVYGIDNTFASRALDEDVLSSYSSKALPASASEFELDGDPRPEDARGPCRAEVRRVVRDPRGHDILARPGVPARDHQRRR
jgi:thiamine transport system substrate-binding protein